MIAVGSGQYGRQVSGVARGVRFGRSCTSRVEHNAIGRDFQISWCRVTALRDRSGPKCLRYSTNVVGGFVQRLVAASFCIYLVGDKLL